MKANDIMTGRVITISPDHSVSHAARMMRENGISGLPVCDDSRRIVGMLTEGDLLRRAELGQAAWPGVGKASSGQAPEDFTKSHSWRVGDVMTRRVITVDEDMPMDRVAAVMCANEIKRVPVTRGDEMVGIVSRRDILRAIAAAVPDVTAVGDQAIRRAIQARLCSDLGLDRGTTDVTVEDGNVSLWGQVDSEAKREAARVAAEAIRGVGRVSNKIRVVAS